MNTKEKVIGLVLIVGVIIGWVAILESGRTPIAGIGAPVGTTNTTPRMVQTVTANLSTTTYATFLNTDGNDRIVTSVEYLMTGYGNSPFTTLQAATNTNPITIGTNYLINWGTISTTTDPVYIAAGQVANQASSTYNIASNAVRIWAAGSYLNFVANATTSGYGTISVKYLSE
jgi:hypothetical protein